MQITLDTTQNKILGLCFNQLLIPCILLLTVCQINSLKEIKAYGGVVDVGSVILVERAGVAASLLFSHIT